MGAGATYKYTTAQKHKYKNDDGERSRDEIKELKSSGQVSCSASFLCTVTRHHQPRHHRHNHLVVESMQACKPVFIQQLIQDVLS